MSDRKAPILPFYHDIQVRYGETDQMRVVYHANYIVWFNEARDNFMGHLGESVAKLEETGLSFPVTEVTCKYILPARYGDTVRVWVEPHFTSVAKLDFDYRITKVKGSAVLCTGSTTNVILDKHGKMLVKLPPALRDVTQTYMKLITDSKKGQSNA